MDSIHGTTPAGVGVVPGALVLAGVAGVSVGAAVGIILTIVLTMAAIGVGDHLITVVASEAPMPTTVGVGADGVVTTRVQLL